MNYRGYNIQL